jgi:hypothetical protein
MTQQPIWKYVGHVGDVDPIAYGGGFIYVDETGVYGPEMTYFQPGPDEDWHKLGGTIPVETHRILLEHGAGEWWYSKLDHIASYTGISLEQLQTDAQSTDAMTLAQLYADLISYFGAHEFNDYPVIISEDEAYAKYADEMNRRTNSAQ